MDLITPLASSCRVATPHDSVLNSECAYTFHTPYSTDAGIVVNLTTYVGTVDALALAGSSGPSEGLFVRIVKKRVEKAPAAEGATPAPAPTKLAIGVEGGFAATDDDKYDTISQHSVVVLEKTDYVFFVRSGENEFLPVLTPSLFIVE